MYATQLAFRVDQVLLQLTLIPVGAATAALTAWAQTRVARNLPIDLGTLHWVRWTTIAAAIGWSAFLIPSVFMLSAPATEQAGLAAGLVGPIAVAIAVASVPLAQTIRLARVVGTASVPWFFWSIAWVALTPVLGAGFGWMNVPDTSPWLAAWAVISVVVVGLVVGAATAWGMARIQRRAR